MLKTLLASSHALIVLEEGLDFTLYCDALVVDLGYYRIDNHLCF